MRGNGSRGQIGKPQRWLLELETKFATLMRAGEIRLAVEALRQEASARGMSSIELGALIAQIGVQRGHTNPMLLEDDDA